MADINGNPPLTVSLSGADRVGKSTLLKLFPRDWPLTRAGTINRYSQEVRRMQSEHTWMGKGGGRLNPEGACDDETFTLNLARACHSRIASFNPTSGFAFDEDGVARIPTLPPALPVKTKGMALDCSGQMHKAYCIARVMALRGLGLDDAVARVESILAAAHTSFPTETIAILIQVAGSQAERAAFSIDRRDGAGPTYTNLNNALQQVFDYQVAQGVYTAVITKSSAEPFIETLYKITTCLQQHAGDTHVWRPLLGNLKLAVAYGGLSECGKSSMCTATVRHNGDSAFRLKISYLCDLVSARLGYNIYDVPSGDMRALEMVHELDLFLRWHRWLTVVTLDSLHNYDFTLCLARLIGNLSPDAATWETHTASVRNPAPFSKNVKLLVVYIDTPLDLRISRTEASGARFDHSKDEVKRSRGADKIEQIADVVVKNDGTLQEMFDTVWTTAEKYL